MLKKPGLENLKINHDVELPKITDHDVLIRVKMAGVNPIDHITVTGTREIKPLPHIPGAETSGEVEECGRHVKRLKKGPAAPGSHLRRFSRLIHPGPAYY